jgi:hypothetical protein
MIKQILHNNKYDTTILNKAIQRHGTQILSVNKTDNKKKIGKIYIRRLKNQIHKETVTIPNLKIFYNTDNTTGKHLNLKSVINTKNLINVVSIN